MLVLVHTIKIGSGSFLRLKNTTTKLEVVQSRFSTVMECRMNLGQCGRSTILSRRIASLVTLPGYHTRLQGHTQGLEGSGGRSHEDTGEPISGRGRAIGQLVQI